MKLVAELHWLPSQLLDVTFLAAGESTIRTTNHDQHGRLPRVLRRWLESSLGGLARAHQPKAPRVLAPVRASICYDFSEVLKKYTFKKK